MSQNKDLILEEIKAIRQSQTESQTMQVKILERLNTIEGEVGGLKTDIQELKTQQSTISGKVIAAENNINNLNFKVNRLEQYSRKSSTRVP